MITRTVWELISAVGQMPGLFCFAVDMQVRRAAGWVTSSPERAAI